MSWEKFSLNRQTVRAATNPLDVCTLVSIYPKPIVSDKPTLFPGKWRLEAGTYDEPSVLKVGPSSWWKDVGLDQPLLEIPVSAINIAASIINDYINGILECDMDTCKPGVFFVEGNLTAKEVKEKRKSELDLAAAKQRNWYESLVRLADIQWARTNGNPLSIADEMRIACTAIGASREWMSIQESAELVRCKACTNLVNKAALICPNCKVVLDAKRFEAAGMKFAS